MAADELLEILHQLLTVSQLLEQPLEREPTRSKIFGTKKFTVFDFAPNCETSRCVLALQRLIKHSRPALNTARWLCRIPWGHRPEVRTGPFFLFFSAVSHMPLASREIDQTRHLGPGGDRTAQRGDQVESAAGGDFFWAPWGSLEGVGGAPAAAASGGGAAE